MPDTRAKGSSTPPALEEWGQGGKCPLYQAHSQACVSGVAKLSQRYHVVQNLGAYFIFYVIKIKWIICLQEKIELSSMSQRARWSSSEISGDLSLVTKIR